MAGKLGANEAVADIIQLALDKSTELSVSQFI